MLSLDQAEIVVDPPLKLNKQEILKRAIKRYKNKSVVLDQNSTPYFNKIYEMPKQHIGDLLKLEDKLEGVPEKVRGNKPKKSKNGTRKWFALPINELHIKDKNISISNVIKSIYLPSSKHVYGTKICLSQGTAGAIHPSEYLKVRGDSKNQKNSKSSRALDSAGL